MGNGAGFFVKTILGRTAGRSYQAVTTLWSYKHFQITNASCLLCSDEIPQRSYFLLRNFKNIPVFGNDLLKLILKGFIKFRFVIQ